MSNEFALQMNRSVFLFGFEFPRYLVLSGIYHVSSFIGFPIFFVIAFLIYLPFFHILRSIFYSNRKVSIFDLCVVSVVFLTIFFYSALSLSILWFIAFYYTRKFIFSLLYFHPISLAFLPFIWFFQRKILFRHILTNSFLFFALNYFLSGGGSSSMAKPIEVDSINFFNVVLYAVGSKYKEIVVMASFPFLYMITNIVTIGKIKSNTMLLLMILSLLFFVLVLPNNSVKNRLLIADYWVIEIFTANIGIEDYEYYRGQR